MNIAALVILVLVLVVMVLRKKWRWPVFQYIFLCRVPVVCGLLLLGLAPMAIWVAKSLLGNLLILSDKWGFFAVALVSVITGNMILQTSMFIVEQAPARFGVDPIVWKPKHGFLAWVLEVPEAWVRCIGSTLLALPLNLFVAWYSWPEYGRHWALVLFLSAGILVGLGLLLLANIVFSPTKIETDGAFAQREEEEKTQQRSGARAETRVSHLFKGYSHKDAAGKVVIQHRHSRMAITAASLIAVFLLGALPWKPGEVPVPALFFVVYLILVYGYVLSGMTFFLDRFRVPLLVFVMWATILLSSFQDSRHYYQVFQLTGQPETLRIQTTPKKDMVPAASQEKLGKTETNALENALLDALKMRLNQQGDQKTLVAMAVTGGGIQAAGWTAQVLTGLYKDEAFGPEFMRATGLISSVSGGTVGSMFFLDRLEELETGGGKADLDQTVKVIRDSAMGNSLPDVAWSLAYQDLFRLFGINWFVSKQNGGRGWALEESFRLRLKHEKAGMRSHWLKAVQKGDLPLPIFNATLVESGDRLLISPFVHPEAARAQSMAQIYPDLDLNVATAARLSATFPYVSPLASPIDSNGERVEPEWHVADGGYFDTYGMFTLVEWLNTVVMPNAGKLGLEQVIIIQINAFPLAKPEEDDLGAWEAAVLGPVNALTKVRVSTQEARNQTELQLLIDSKGDSGVAFNHFDLRYKLGPDIEGERLLDPAESKSKKEGDTIPPDPPYSWKLSQKERERIGKAWEHWLESDQKKQLAKIWKASLTPSSGAENPGQNQPEETPPTGTEQ